MIITENKTGIRFKSIGRRKKLDFTLSTGRSYFRWNNIRYYLDDIMRVSYPIMCHVEYENDIDFILSGYISITNLYGVLVSISDGGEYVTLWEQIDE